MATIVDSTLVTLTQFRVWAQSANRKVTTGTDPAVLQTLRAAQDAAEMYAGRRFFVHKITEDWKTWENVNVGGERFQSMYTRQYPVVEIDTTGLSIYTKDHPDVPRRVYASTATPTDNEFVYYAGYKRTDQNIGALQAFTQPTDLSALGTLPDDCPDDLASAICEAALLMLGRVAQNHVAHGGVELEQVGVAVTTASRLPRSEARNIFVERIPHYRHISGGFA